MMTFEDSMWDMYLRSNIVGLMPKLEGGLFHCTDIRGFCAICKSGWIEPNTGQNPFSFPQSQSSFGFNNGWISLFDFAGREERDLALHHWKWQSFFIATDSARVICTLDRADLVEKLIPNSIRPLPSDDNYRMAIPCVEAWYPEPIDIQSIRNCILTVQQNSELVVSDHESTELFNLLKESEDEDNMAIT